MKIAMWSGPRNLSTAMMYSFASRADCAVSDEPFYAAYLKATGLQHPMRDEILAKHESDSAKVERTITGSNPNDLPIWYQKHMPQHMVDGFPIDWTANVTNVFLLRHPARVVASFSAKYDATTISDTGFIQQAKLFDEIAAKGDRPVVIDSADIRRRPQEMLQALCRAVNIPWDAAMLSWPKGGLAEDGIWARHWYGAVHNSTGFAGAEGELPIVTGAAAEIVDEVMPHYARLKEFALTVD